ncbi:MAG: chain-length determining protein [Synechococcus sp.]|nr:chain-length determining protein [Synechococcus sp.]
MTQAPPLPSFSVGNPAAAAGEALQSDSLAAPPGSTPERSASGAARLLRTIRRRQGLFLLVFSAVSAALALNTLRERLLAPVYQGGFQIQISNPFEARGPAGNQSGNQTGSGALEMIARKDAAVDVPSVIVLLRSPLLIAPVAEKQGVASMALIHNLAIAPAAAYGKQRVENVLDVTLRWPDPVQGKAILTQIAQAYTAFSLAQKQAVLDSGLEFLDRQAPEILARVDRLQAQMLRFRQRNNNLDPADNARQILASREALVQKQRELQNQQVQLTTQIASIQSGRLRWFPSGAPAAYRQLGEQGAATPGRGAGADAAAGTTTPLQQLNQSETELAVARATFREESPLVQSLLARRNALIPVVRRQSSEELRALLLANLAQQDEINRQILLLNRNFHGNPRQMRDFDDLQGRLALARQHYSSYIQARENFRLELARSTISWQVISPARFTDLPVEPNLRTDLARALFLGLLAGVAAVTLRERSDDLLHTPADAERELQLPVLGLIPHLPLEPDVAISRSLARLSEEERFALQESLRSLFTALRARQVGRSLRMLGITSSSQGEGKTAALILLARTLADLGLKVLLVESDLRLPGLDTGSAAVAGLSGLLTTTGKLAIRDSISAVAAGFDLLPAGVRPADPARLLHSRRCRELVEAVRQLSGYDLVLWDAPPCLMLADPILLGEKLDGMLFLVGLGKASRDLAPQACRRIRACGIPLLGLICNQVIPPGRLHDYGYDHGYFRHCLRPGSAAAADGETSDQGATPRRRRPAWLVRSGAGSGRPLP